MAIRDFYGGLLVSGLYSYRVHFLMLSAAGAGVTGLSGGLTVRRAKANETGGGTITRTITELSSANLPGLYQITLQAADLDTPGPLSLKFTGAGADDSHLTLFVLNRGSVVVG